MSCVLMFSCSNPHHYFYDFDSSVVWSVNPYLPFLALTTFIVLFLYYPILSYIKLPMWPIPIQMTLILLIFISSCKHVSFFIPKVLLLIFFAFLPLKCSFSHIKIVQSYPFKGFSERL